MNIEEVKKEVKTKSSEFWSKFGRHILIGVSVIVIIVGLVLIGRWYASGKADQFARDLHNQWALGEGRALYDNIAITKKELEELKQSYQEQSDKIDRLKKNREVTIINVIKENDPKKLASMFDNLVDGYTPPASFGK